MERLGRGLVGRRAVIAGAAAACLAGCARGRDPAALSFWAMSYEGDYSPHLMPTFERATGIAVDVQSLPLTASHEKLLTAFAGGALPDVMMLPGGWVGEFAMIGAIRPLPDPTFVADVFPAAMAGARYDGRMFAVPWSVGPQMQFYRTDILASIGHAEPPADWIGWREMARALKRRRPDDFAVLLYLNWADTLITFAQQAGARLLRDRDTRGVFSEPAFRTALAFYKSLFDEGLAPRALSTEVQDPVAAFAQGYFAIVPHGPALLLDLHRRAAEIPGSRWAVARMPGPNGHGPVSAVSASIAVSSQTRRPAEAWALVRHVTSLSSELQFQRLIGNLPARRSAWSSAQLTAPALAPCLAQLHAPALPPQIVEWERVRAEVQLLAERVVRGEFTVEEGTRAMDARVDALLAKRRALVEAGRIA